MSSIHTICKRHSCLCVCVQGYLLKVELKGRGRALNPDGAELRWWAVTDGSALHCFADYEHFIERDRRPATCAYDLAYSM